MIGEHKYDHLNELERHYRPSACRSTTHFFSERKKGVGEWGHSYDESGNFYRTYYQHDRDKILYSHFFRRLRLKTQIFPEQTSDHLRTRLDHTLEVAQIARHFARQLKLNEDLVDAIALGHDIGHAPFAHSGERALHLFLKNKEQDLKQPIDGFRHNWQGLRVADLLENMYPDSKGLNLTRAVRLGILKHTNLEYSKDIKSLAGPCYCDIHAEISAEFAPSPASSVYDIFEVQITELADEFAQAVHDFEDGIIAKNLSLRECIEQDDEYPLIKACLKEIKKRWHDADTIDYTNSEAVSFLLHRIRSELIFQLTLDATNNSKIKLQKWEDDHLKSVQKHEAFNEFVKERNDFPRLIELDKKKDAFKKLKDVLKKRVIRSERVSRMDGKADYVIRKILEVYLSKPGQVPEGVMNLYRSAKGLPNSTNIRQLKEEDLEKLGYDKQFIRATVDYVAGMTDRYALREFDKLYSAYPRTEL